MQLFDFSYEFPNTIEEVDDFSGKDFEVFLFEFFKILNFEPRLTDDTNDKGIDLLIKVKEGNAVRNVGIQAKRWKSKVGADEIRTMLDGKEHYNLQEVWIITTSHLTSSAITTAKNNRIQILTRTDVMKFLEELKKHENVKFRKLSNDKIKKADKIKEINLDAEDDNNPLFEEFKKLRLALSKKHKIYPIYLIYNNSTIKDIIKFVPETKEELSKIEGLGEKKIATFGEDIIQVLKVYFENSVSKNQLDKLRVIRSKIISFNKLDENILCDNTLKSIVINKPKTIEELKSLEVISQEDLDIFGLYLVKQIKNLY